MRVRCVRPSSVPRRLGYRVGDSSGCCAGRLVGWVLGWVLVRPRFWGRRKGWRRGTEGGSVELTEAEVVKVGSAEGERREEYDRKC